MFVEFSERLLVLGFWGFVEGFRYHTEFLRDVSRGFGEFRGGSGLFLWIF